MLSLWKDVLLINPSLSVCHAHPSSHAVGNVGSDNYMITITPSEHFGLDDDVCQREMEGTATKTGKERGALIMTTPIMYGTCFCDPSKVLRILIFTQHSL